MNQLYERTIEVNGKTYHYDPDQDIYYVRWPTEDTSHFDQYGWIYLIVIMTVVAWILS
jgi:hypothetical protein